MSAALALLRVTLVARCVMRRAARQMRHVSLRHVTTFLYAKMHGLDSVS